MSLEVFGLLEKTVLTSGSCNSRFDTDFSGAGTDDDDNFSEVDDKRKIFLTLQDSATVLPQIQFQASWSGAGRLPRVRSSGETYETLHQVCSPLGLHVCHLEL